MSNADPGLSGHEGGSASVRRSSPGGYAVSDSLSAVAYRADPAVALVETVRPGLRRHAAVVSQNAWNFIPGDEFADLCRSYGSQRRQLYRARRAVAGINCRRSRSNIVLSEYMASLLRRRGLDPIVVPVTLPIDLCADAGPEPTPVAGVEGPFVVVPGTLTWYKDAEYAIDLLQLIPEPQRPLIVLAGTDDGSGCQEYLRSRLLSVRQPHRIGPATRAQMSWLLRNALATVVPSRLESLSFSLAEALVLSPRVWASPLTVHHEVAGRIGRTPSWLPSEPDEETANALLLPPGPMSPLSTAPFAEDWHRLAGVLTTQAGR